MEKAADIVLACLRKKNMTQRELARRMGEDVRGINQQLNRAHDMKVSRFEDMLEHIGFQLDIVDSGGTQKVCREYGEDVICDKFPFGKFYISCGDGKYTGIKSKPEGIFYDDFDSFDDCMRWLGCEVSGEWEQD